MKHAFISLGIIIALIASTVINSFVLRGIVDTYIERIESAEGGEGAEEFYTALYDEFISDEGYISLTVSHEDLRDIEKSFSEVIAAEKMKDADEAEKAKSRLIDALLHLKRLCGINIDSIL
ncbi:MAG: DUF4363 family protein [Clostridia bacterium]|nr:DUF4363 family protein [Clostridia bacterium]